MTRAGTIPKMIFLVLAFAGIIGLQFAYDLLRPILPASQAGVLPASMVRLVDMGFHATAASFLWVATMPEIFDLFRGRTEFLSDVSYVNAVDPKMSYPYAFSVLTLPAVQNFPDRMRAAMAIGQRGLANADPDWRIPYYLAADYYLDIKDTKSALQYYDLAARTPGIPPFAVVAWRQ